jgi:hypothetical protein
METFEADLRMLLGSRNSQIYGQSILNAVRNGEVVTIQREDGTALKLTEVSKAKQILGELFGWKCPSMTRLAGERLAGNRWMSPN